MTAIQVSSLTSEDLVRFQERIIGRLTANESYDASQFRLGVTCGHARYLFDMKDIQSILPVPAVIRAPKTKSWLTGIANLRGELYSVIDFGKFNGGEAVDVREQAKVLMLNPIYRSGACLLVESVVGLVPMTDMKSTDGEIFSNVSTHENWRSVDIESIVKSESFLKVKR